MENRKRKFILLIHLFILSVFTVKGQDLQFSQFYNVSTYYNPATVCLHNDVQATLSSRQQWLNASGGINSYFGSIEGKVYQKKLYLGLLAYDETVHSYLKNSRAELMFAQRLYLKKYIFQFGFSLLSFNQKYIDYNSLQFSDQFDPYHGAIYSTGAVFDDSKKIIYADWNLGFVFKRKQKRTGNHITPTFGAAVHHLSSPKISSTGDEAIRLKRKYIAHTELLFRYDILRQISSRRQQLLIKPACIIEVQDPFRTLTVGTKLYALNLSTGLWFRSWYSPDQEINCVILSLGANFDLTEKSTVAIEYSYDATTSHLGITSGGSHEICLRYFLDYTLRFKYDCRPGDVKRFNQDREEKKLKPIN